MASSPGGTDTQSSDVTKPVFRTVKLFDLGLAPAFIRIAYDWQDAAEEWALHRCLRENGAAEGENVLLQSDDLT
jgi:hypothetical protein